MFRRTVYDTLLDKSEIDTVINDRVEMMIILANLLKTKP